MKKHKNLKTVLYSSLVLGAVVVAFNANTAGASAATNSNQQRWGQAQLFDAAAATDTPAKEVAAVFATDGDATTYQTSDTAVNSATVDQLTAAVKAASDANDSDGATKALKDLDAYYLAVGDNALDAQGTIPIDEAHFPDSIFRAFVATIAQQATGKDVKVLTPDTLKMFGQLDLTNLHFDNLTGIQYFKAIQKLTLNGNNVGDLSILKDNPILGELYAHDMGPELATADVSELPILYKAQFGSLGATSISDDADNIDLKAEDVTVTRDQNLKKIVTNSTLDELGVVFSDSLTTIDTSQSSHLTTLQLSHNGGLKNLDVTKNPELQLLTIRDSSAIEKLDLSNNTSLTNLTIAMTPPDSADKNSQVTLKDVTLPDAKKLSLLDLENLSITADQLAKGLETYTELDSLVLQNTGLKTVDLSNNPGLTVAVLANNQLTDIAGLAKLQNLDSLFVGSNQLTSLDLSKNPRVARVNAADNQLKTLKVAPQSTANGGQKISYLDVRNNKLDEASFNSTLAQLSGLTTLLASDNNLTHVDLAKNIYLSNIDLSNNHLRTLDMSTNVSNNRSGANISGQTVADQAFYAQKDAQGATKYYFNLKQFLNEASTEDLAQYATVPAQIDWKLDPTTGVAVYQGTGQPTDIEYTYNVGAMLTMPVHVDLQADPTVAAYHVDFAATDSKTTVTAKTVDLSSTDDGVLTADQVPAYKVNDANYHFVGWEDATGQAIKLNQAGQIIGSKTLYAVVAPNAYTISFDTAGGTKLADTQAKTASGSKTSTYTLPAGPTKADFSFTGWEDDRGNTYKAGDTVKLTADTKFTAQYQANGATAVKLAVAVTSNKATDTGATLTGTATAGASLAVVDQYGVTVATGTADSKGAFTLTAKGVVAGDTLTVTATKTATATQTYTTATANKVVAAEQVAVSVPKTTPKTPAPAKKKVATSLKLDKAYTANKYVTGKTEAKAQVTVTTKAGKVLGKVKAATNGKFKVKLKTTKAQTVYVSVKAIDTKTTTKNTTKKALKVTKSPAPKRSTLKVTKKTFTGKTTQGATVKLYNAKGKVVAQKHVTTKNGKFSIKLKQTYKKGTKFTVKVQNDHAHGFAKAQTSFKAK
ncbi:hypothetical protein EQG49_07280 [Periweissella cryptocerci]|uniref:Bacterial Ig domain-containing protein n=1 Tax=Periweissella cryptocerci TaxID=2506420 RepID=A0A4P6YUB9_9LACO|nr:Ig-like domain-containing protein [Periweissella cryptocerci]QBO36277.1 hypothetical protein EQG49_07280 [Periweissella cryptocerci]